MELKTVNIADLKFNEVQPEYRTERKNLHGLLGSIKQYGVMQPILVNKKTMEIIDGHRRVAVCRIEGMDKIPVIFYNGELHDKTISSMEAFTICNSNTKPLKRVDYVSIFKKGGNVPANIANDLIKITERLGSAYIEKLIERRQSPNTMTRFISLGDALGYSKKMDMRIFINWVFEHKMWFMMRTFSRDIIADPSCIIAQRVKESVINNIPLVFEIK